VWSLNLLLEFEGGGGEKRGKGEEGKKRRAGPGPDIPSRTIPAPKERKKEKKIGGRGGKKRKKRKKADERVANIFRWLRGWPGFRGKKKGRKKRRRGEEERGVVRANKLSPVSASACGQTVFNEGQPHEKGKKKVGEKRGGKKKKNGRRRKREYLFHDLYTFPKPNPGEKSRNRKKKKRRKKKKKTRPQIFFARLPARVAQGPKKKAQREEKKKKKENQRKGGAAFHPTKSRQTKKKKKEIKRIPGRRGYSSA